jgi:hypothetical protein
MNEFGIIDTNCWQETKITPNIRTFVNTDSPQIIHIITSGWVEPQMYSVVIEDGELGCPDLKFMTKDLIKITYNINI